MSVSNRPQSVESDAERMIDSLFIEIDQVLEVNNSFQALAWRKKEYFSSQGTYISRTEFTAHWNQNPPGELDYQSPNSLSRATPRDLISSPELVEDDHQLESQTTQPPLWLRHLDKIVFSSSCSLLLLSLFSLEKNPQLNLANFSTSQSTITTPKQSPKNQEMNQRFLDYMERAISEINHQNALAEKVRKTELAQGKKESVIVSSATESTEKKSPKVEKNTISSLPALAPPPPPTPEKAPATPETTTPPPNNPPPRETPPPASSEASTSSPSESEKPKPSSPTPQAIPTHTLIGLLELGDDSAALLKVNGTTQRVMLGESIPGSNWQLISVVDQEATFVNNSKQTSLYVGEKIAVE